MSFFPDSALTGKALSMAWETLLFRGFDRNPGGMLFHTLPEHRLHRFFGF
jgi:hypothetical protein